MRAPSAFNARLWTGREIARKKTFPASTAEKAPVARRQAKERWIEKAYSINSGESEGGKERVTQRKKEGESDCGQNHTAIFKRG